jgi:hypothetical protein
MENDKCELSNVKNKSSQVFYDARNICKNPVGTLTSLSFCVDRSLNWQRPQHPPRLRNRSRRRFANKSTKPPSQSPTRSHQNSIRIPLGFVKSGKFSGSSRNQEFLLSARCGPFVLNLESTVLPEKLRERRRLAKITQVTVCPVTPTPGASPPLPRRQFRDLL